jgi:hypothetical protein
MHMPATVTDPIAERFARESAEHAIAILHDDGLYRHVRFMAPKRSAYWYELITVPGSLVFRGDGTSFVFALTADMFGFFRSNPDRATMRISPDYWAEKLTSDRDSVRTYSREKLEQHAAEALEHAEEHWPGVTAAWAAQTGADALDYDLDYEEPAREALRDFAYRPTGHTGEPFRFRNTWEWDLRDFDWWYLWACHAIVTGIARYDQAKTTAAPQAKQHAARVWSGYDDDERGFPLFTTREAAQDYVAYRYRQDCANWGTDATGVQITWSERKAYTDAHDGRAGMFDLTTPDGRTDYIVHELPIHPCADDAIRADRELDDAAE